MNRIIPTLLSFINMYIYDMTSLQQNLTCKILDFKGEHNYKTKHYTIEGAMTKSLSR